MWTPMFQYARHKMFGAVIKSSAKEGAAAGVQSEQVEVM